MSSAHIKLDFTPLVGRMRKVEEGVFRSVRDSGVKTLIYQSVLNERFVSSIGKVTGATDDSISQLAHNDLNGKTIKVEPEVHTKGVYVRRSGGKIDDSGIYVDPIDLYKGQNTHYGDYAVSSSISNYALHYDEFVGNKGMEKVRDRIIDIIKEQTKI